MSAITTTAVPTKQSLIQRYPLGAFFALAIGLTWIFMITDALGSHGILSFRLPIPLMIVMGYMPTLAAVIVMGQTKGKAGVRALLTKLVVWRVGLRWYCFAIFGLVLAYIAVILFHNLLPGSLAVPILSDKLPPLPWWQLPLYLVPMFIVISIVNGEELGWRGFALPRLQSKYNALTSSIILGLIWTVFHLPLFFTVTGSSQADWSFTNFLVSTVVMSILYTWMYNNTRGSVLMAYLFHGAANTWSQVFSIDHGDSSLAWILTGVLVLVAVIVVTTAGAENLSHTNIRIKE